MILTKQMIAHLAKYYPDGADIVEAKGYVHVQRPNGSDGALIGGELDSEPGMAGCIGMTRSTSRCGTRGELRVRFSSLGRDNSRNLNPDYLVHGAFRHQ